MDAHDNQQRKGAIVGTDDYRAMLRSLCPGATSPARSAIGRACCTSEISIFPGASFIGSWAVCSNQTSLFDGALSRLEPFRRQTRRDVVIIAAVEQDQRALELADRTDIQRHDFA